MRNSPKIGLDTEFVSEDSYRPQLCLVQIALENEGVLIDPFTAGSLDELWSILAEEGRETVVHAGREEVLFCVEAIGREPSQVFDTQLAAGFIGCEYPASYGSLVSKILRDTPEKGETRTDWRRRPLSDRQISYALADVRHLIPLQQHLRAKLGQLNRLEWLTTETLRWLKDVKATRGPERWRKVAGSAGLGARNLAIVRELWKWREEMAKKADQPSRRILRDDLLVELAKRRSADPKQIRAVRGMERSELKKSIGDLSKVIETALAIQEEDLPRPIHRDNQSHLTMVGQFLSSALTSICRQAQVSHALVGTPSDVRDLVAFRLEGEVREAGDLPSLITGWRATIVGRVLDELLQGKLSIRIKDPESDHPLVFE